MHGQIKGKFVSTMYLVGVILDTLVGIDLLQAVLTGQTFMVFAPTLTDAVRYFGIQVVVFMFGWTILLYWGYREPIDRRALLLMTAFPIVAGLLCSNLFAIAIGLGDVIQIIRNIAIQSGLIVGFLVSFYFAETYTRKKAQS
ncbi:MAG: hypothetical protein ACFFEV_03700 [Candidatus Thorarchaeota archaeon]